MSRHGYKDKRRRRESSPSIFELIGDMELRRVRKFSYILFGIAFGLFLLGFLSTELKWIFGTDLVDSMFGVVLLLLILFPAIIAFQSVFSDSDPEDLEFGYTVKNEYYDEGDDEDEF